MMTSVASVIEKFEVVKLVKGECDLSQMSNLIENRSTSIQSLENRNTSMQSLENKIKDNIRLGADKLISVQKHKLLMDKLKFKSDVEILDLQISDHSLYLSRQEAIVLADRKMDTLNVDLALIRANEKAYLEQMKVQLGDYKSIDNFKLELEYVRCCQYLKVKNPHLDLSAISKTTVISKAHQLFNDELVHKLYFDVTFAKRLKGYHNKKRQYDNGYDQYGCGYKGGQLCNCGKVVTWIVPQDINWVIAITLGSEKPVGQLQFADYI